MVAATAVLVLALGACGDGDDAGDEAAGSDARQLAEEWHRKIDSFMTPESNVDALVDQAAEGWICGETEDRLGFFFARALEDPTPAQRMHQVLIGYSFLHTYCPSTMSAYLDALGNVHPDIRDDVPEGITAEWDEID
jgi:hypothetical protein